MTRKPSDRLLRFAASSNGPLGENAAHVFALRHALVHYASGAIYTFIPKNACTTLRFAMARANGCLSGIDQFQWVHKNNATFQANLRDLQTTQDSFVVLRCPHARLASVFIDKVASKQASVLWKFRAFHDRSFEPDDLTFRQFVQLMTKPGALRSDHHWRPQADFLIYEDYDHWIAMENLAASVPILETVLGVDITDTRKIAKHGTDQYVLLENGPFADMPAIEMHALIREGKCPSHKALYTPDIADTVSRLYAEDIAIYDSRFRADARLFGQI